MAPFDDERTPPYNNVKRRPKGTGPGSAGQSGDTQGLSDEDDVSFQSVEELVEEGQGTFEAGVISGMEEAEDRDAGLVKTHEVPEEDVPFEYDNPEPDTK
jgi:hypothetical protein